MAALLLLRELIKQHQGRLLDLSGVVQIHLWDPCPIQPDARPPPPQYKVGARICPMKISKLSPEASTLNQRGGGRGVLLDPSLVILQKGVLLGAEISWPWCCLISSLNRLSFERCTSAASQNSKVIGSCFGGSGAEQSSGEN